MGVLGPGNPVQLRSPDQGLSVATYITVALVFATVADDTQGVEFHTIFLEQTDALHHPMVGGSPSRIPAAGVVNLLGTIQGNAHQKVLFVQVVAVVAPQVTRRPDRLEHGAKGGGTGQLPGIIEGQEVVFHLFWQFGAQRYASFKKMY